MFVRLEKVDKKVITQEKYLILLFIYFLTNGILQTHHSDHDRHNRRQNRNRRRCCPWFLYFANPFPIINGIVKTFLQVLICVPLFHTIFVTIVVIIWPIIFVTIIIFIVAILSQRCHGSVVCVSYTSCASKCYVYKIVFCITVCMTVKNVVKISNTIILQACTFARYAIFHFFTFTDDYFGIHEVIGLVWKKQEEISLIN